jgi:hypothetical protein
MPCHLHRRLYEGNFPSITFLFPRVFSLSSGVALHRDIKLMKNSSSERSPHFSNDSETPIEVRQLTGDLGDLKEWRKEVDSKLTNYGKRMEEFISEIKKLHRKQGST